MDKAISVQFLITVSSPDGKKAKVEIRDAFRDREGKDAPFIYYMCVAEYLCHLVAGKSNAGYEKALELICKGAMTYKHIAPNNIEDL